MSGVRGACATNSRKVGTRVTPCFAKKRGKKVIPPELILKEKPDNGGTEPKTVNVGTRNVESLRNLILRLELYERSQYISQKEEEENFVVALRKWLDGDDCAIDDWLGTL